MVRAAMPPPASRRMPSLRRIAAGARAEGAIGQRPAELVEEGPVHRAVLHHAQRAGVAARQSGLRVLGRERLQARRDFVERLLPADAAELALAFAPDALHRMEQ